MHGVQFADICHCYCRSLSRTLIHIATQIIVIVSGDLTNRKYSGIFFGQFIQSMNGEQTFVATTYETKKICRCKLNIIVVPI